MPPLVRVTFSLMSSLVRTWRILKARGAQEQVASRCLLRKNDVMRYLSWVERVQRACVGRIETSRTSGVEGKRTWRGPRSARRTGK